MRRTVTSLLASLVLVLAGCLLPLSAVGAVVFETIADVQFVGRGPGPDGFIGTDDDVPDANNTAGTLSYAISLSAVPLYSESTTTINEPFVFENGISTITDFSADGTLVPGFSFVDDPDACLVTFPFFDCSLVLPHEMVTTLEGRTDGEYYLWVCSGGPPCVKLPGFSRPIAAGFANQSSRGEGFSCGAVKTRSCFRGSTTPWRPISTN